MKKALVLGAGLVGVTIAKDLADEFDVTVLDTSSTALAKINDERIECFHIDSLPPHTFWTHFIL